MILLMAIVSINAYEYSSNRHIDENRVGILFNQAINMSYDKLTSILADDVKAVEEMEIPRRKFDRIINENSKLEQISQWE